MRKLAGLAVILMAVGGAVGCSNNENKVDANPAAIDAHLADGALFDGGISANHSVSAMNLMFMPGTMTIRVGDTVTWTNMDAVLHTVTSGTGSTSPTAGQLFDHQLAPGTTFTFRFTQTGSFRYFCRIHEFLGMRGTINVTP